MRTWGLPILLGLAWLGIACSGGPLESASVGDEGRILEPLPPAPVIRQEQEPLPGADGRLAVVATRPHGPVQGAVRPTLTFSKPMISLATVEEQETFPAPAAIDPPVEGSWQWIGSASVEFVPAGAFPYGTAYRVTIPAGLQAVDGSRLEAAQTFEFSTPAPVVQNVQPLAGYRWLTETPRFVLLMNQQVVDLGAQAWLQAEGSERKIPLRVVEEKRVVEELRAAEGQRTHGRQAPGAEGVRNEQTRYTLEPTEKLPQDTGFVLVVGEGLRGVQGPLPMGRESRFPYRTHGPMRFTGVMRCQWGADTGDCPWGPPLLLSSNLVDPKSLKERLTIEPAVEIDWENVQTQLPNEWSNVRDPWIVLPGRFHPGTTYVLRVDPGVVDEFGQRAEAFEARFRMDDRRPSFNVGSDIALLESGGEALLPVETVNVDALDVSLWRLTPAEMARWLHHRYQQRFSVGPPTSTLRLDTRATQNKTRWTGLDVRQVFGGPRSGLFAARFKAGFEPRHTPTVLGQVTDLAVHSKLGPTSGLVWVTRLSSGEPVARAKITLLDKEGKRMAEARTDADGIARVPGLSTLPTGENDPSYRWEAPFALAVAELGDEIGVTLSTWMDGLSPSAFDMPSAWEGREPVALGLVFTERGIYRPGDTVHVKGLVRYRRMGELVSPKAGTRVELALSDSRGNEVGKKAVEVSPFGTFDGTWEVPKEAPLGTWQIAATTRVDEQTLHYDGSFRVEAYRAPQFQVDVKMRASDVVAGDPLQATVLARYLFGGAMSDADVKWTATRSTMDYTPPGNEGFAFGSRTWWWDDGNPRPTTEVIGGGEAKVDATGSWIVDMGKAEAPASKTWSYTVEAEVSDVNRQRLANRSSATVHPAAYYVGARQAGTGFAETGKESRIELIATRPDGKRVEKAPIAVSIKLRSWKSIRKKGAFGQWFTISEPEETEVATCNVASAATPQACAFIPVSPGMYVYEATVTDPAGRTQTTRDSMYVVGSGWVSWQRNDTDRIDLVADKAVYEPGDTARILVKSPYPEAEALVTVERSGVTSARRVRLSGSATTLEVPIGEDAIPNVYVGVILVRGRVEEGGLESGEDAGRPAVRVGYALLRVEKKSRRLSVSLSPDAGEKRPGEKVRVDLQVKDWQGKGAAGTELTVWAVDEGVLRLTDYQVPDPVEALHPLIGLSVRIGEPLIHLVQRRLYGEKGQTPGGGGGDGSGGGFRSRFQTTVLFAPSVITDAQGRARVEFEVPDNLTTWRIMAVAVSRDDRFGTGQSEVKVAKPLLALPALPRLARVGDHFEAGVVVHTHRFQAPRVTVTASAEGLKLESEPRKAVELEPGKATEVRFRFVADQAGVATLRFAVEGGGERDGVEQKLPIQLPVTLEAVATAGDTRDEAREKLLPPKGVRPDVGGLEITLSSTALAGLDENMRQLVEYPYGCLEQEASRLVPFVALRDLAGRFGVPWDPATVRDWVGADALASRGSTDPDEVIRKTITAIEALQLPGGGYGYWSSSPCASPFGSAWAVWALSRAKDVGFAVNEASLARGKAYLGDKVAAGACESCGWGCVPPDDATRTFALYVLARAGSPKPSYYEQLVRNRKELPLFAQAMLANAMFVGGGDRTQARQILDELLNHAKESPTELHFEETDPGTYVAVWSSDTRTTALVLETLVGLSPDHPFVPKMATWLKRIRGTDGRYRSTQEAAWALVALSEVSRVRETEAPSFTASVKLAGTALVSEGFEGRSLAIVDRKVPMSKVAGGGDLSFAKEGQGLLYYGARLRYAPAEMPTDPLDRGFTVQRWFEPWAGGGQARTFFAGELIRVRVRIASSQQRNYAVIEVPVPAGLEVVDTSLATTAVLPTNPTGEGSEEGYEYESAEDLYGGERNPEDFSLYAHSFYSPFNHTEKRDDRVVIFADRLPPGVHATSFVARATTPGTFVLPPVTAEEMYAPEVFGRSDGGAFEVRIGTPVVER